MLAYLFTDSGHVDDPGILETTIEEIATQDPIQVFTEELISDEESTELDQNNETDHDEIVHDEASALIFESYLDSAKKQFAKLHKQFILVYSQLFLE